MASEKIMSRSPGLINDERWCWKGRKEGKERQIFIAGINCYLGGFIHAYLLSSPEEKRIYVLKLYSAMIPSISYSIDSKNSL